MKKMYRNGIIALAAAAALFAVSVRGIAAEKTELTVSSAASLKDAMLDIKKLYKADYPGVELLFNFGGSGSLQQQIEQGAPVDLFISASPKQINDLCAKKLLVEDSVHVVVKNEVVLIVPAKSKMDGDFSVMKLPAVKKIALGETKSVPVGQYSLEILEALKLKDAVLPKAVFAKDVREVLTWVETENADAGIVYKTDALISKGKVRILCSAPSGSHKPVIYPSAIIAAGKNLKAAQSFSDYLLTKKAQDVFVKYGFVSGK